MKIVLLLSWALAVAITDGGHSQLGPEPPHSEHLIRGKPSKPCEAAGGQCMSKELCGGDIDKKSTCKWSNLKKAVCCIPGKPIETCKYAGGQCLPEEKCGGNINKNLECKCEKEVCCIIESTNQCLSEGRNNSKVWEKINSAVITLLATVKEGNNDTIGTIDTKVENLENEHQLLKQNQEMIMGKQEILISLLGDPSEEQGNIGTKVNNLENGHQILKQNQKIIMGQQENTISLLEDLSEEQGTIGTKVNNLENEHQTLKQNQEMIMEQQVNTISLLDDLSEEQGTIGTKVNNLETEHQILKQNQEIIIGKLEDLSEELATCFSRSSTTSTTACTPCSTITSCPASFFNVGSQCYKIYTDKARSWEDSKSKCASEGLLMAGKTNDPITLRKNILEYFGNKYVWLGAKGDGTVFRWIGTNAAISNTDDFWAPGEPRSHTTTIYCLLLLTNNENTVVPTQPYYSWPCSSDSAPLGGLFALCEYLMQ